VRARRVLLPDRQGGELGAQGVCGWRGERWQGSPVVWVNLP
jgi:hypothetical protein